MAFPLVERFVASLPEAARPAFEPSAELEAQLRELADQGEQSRRERDGARASAPPFDAETFVAAIAERLPDDATPRALAQVRPDELELALACGVGDNHAIAALERRFFGEVEGALARLRLDRSRLDEVKQTLRASLFVSSGEGRAPKIESYSGRGSLGRWLCVTAVRIELMARRGTRPISADDGLLGALPAQRDDPELEHLKSHYRHQFAEAFGRAMKALDDRQRNLLRQHYLDGLNIDRLGALYDVHRATAARWIARAREVLYEQTRDALRAMLDVDDSTYDSILRLIQSQLDLSIRSYLTNSD
ncbi:MAG: transcriptional regulator [Myxococcales bacterium]|nr:transcriptional regulator [Myxococcales bacterium]